MSAKTSEIRQRILNAKVNAAGQPGRQFLPNGSLDEILSPPNVAEALQDDIFRVPEHKRKRCADIIAQRGKKTFALLLELSLEAKLSDFIQNDLLDENLRTDESSLRKIIPEAASTFAIKRWDYLCRKLAKDVYRISLERNEVLPYIENEEIGKGGYSKVYKIRIHLAHQEESTEKPLDLVRKELNVDNGQGALDECELLFLLENIKHRNLIEIFAAYSQNGFTNILLERAEFDLAKFMTMDPRPPGFQETWCIFKAFKGLAAGLRHLHDFRLSSMSSHDSQGTSMKGCHHDLKPQNVLVRGTDFVLTDFGLSRLKELDQDSNTPWKDGTFAYGPPECRDPETWKRGELGRAADIWSIGCILLEATVYAEFGPQEVNDFKTDRCVQSSFGKVEAFHHDRKPHSAVSTRLKRLETAERKDWGLGAVVALVRQTLSSAPIQRPKAEQVENQIARITMQALLLQLFHNVAGLSNEQSPTHSKMFITRIHLENDRLRAWCAVLGLISITQTKDLDRQDFLVAALYQLNNNLYGFLPQAERHEANSLFAVLTSNVDSLDLLSSIRDEACRRDSSTYENVGKMAAMKYMALLYEQNVATGKVPRLMDAILIEKDSGNEDESTRPQTYWRLHGLGSTEKEMVLVEWKGYGEHWSTKDSSSEEFKNDGEAMFLRIRNLVAMLQVEDRPRSSRTLSCLGAFHKPDERCFGIVYRFPSQNSPPVRLRRLLKSKDRKPCSRIPDLEVKIRLASVLICAVKEFHMSGWLHKNITSSNILFFPESFDRWDTVDFASPFIVGFRQSREDLPHAYTEGIDNDTEEEYQHPLYRNRQKKIPFGKPFDLYSLGLVLLEIGVWAALSDVYESQENRTASPTTLKGTYVGLCEKKLRGTMGRSYSNATKACLEAAENVGQDLESTQVYFQREVVDIISNISL